jgi:mannose-6-phosphate isomerase-like protein (cupin superfamily)
VLESSPGLEVIELSSPAEHETLADHDLALPTAEVRRDRDFSGQRFVHHDATAAAWGPSRWSGVDARDLGLAAATRGALGAQVLRGGGDLGTQSHRGELLFAFVLKGEATLHPEGHASERLGEKDAFVVPPGVPYRLAGLRNGLELLVVTAPATTASEYGTPA